MKKLSIYNGYKDYFFLSYSGKDKKALRAVADVLIANDYRVWYDEGLVAGEKFEEVLMHRIACSKCVIILVSKNTAASRYCRKELMCAAKHGVPVRPLLVDDTDEVYLPDLLLEDLHYISFSSPTWLGDITEGCDAFRFRTDPSLTVKNGVLTACTQAPNDLVIPERVIALRDGLFQKNARVVNLRIDSSDELNRKIGSRCFRGSKVLNTVYAPDGLHLIGEEAFRDCKALEYVKISGGVYQLKARAFAGCTALSTFIVFGGISFLEEETFAGCCNLLYFYLLSPPKRIARAAFSGWTEEQMIRFYFDRSYTASWDPGWDEGCAAKIIFDETP